MAVWLHHSKCEITSSQCEDCLSYLYFMSPKHLSEKLTLLNITSHCTNGLRTCTVGMSTHALTSMTLGLPCRPSVPMMRPHLWADRALSMAWNLRARMASWSQYSLENTLLQGSYLGTDGQETHRCEWNVCINTTRQTVLSTLPSIVQASILKTEMQEKMKKYNHEKPSGMTGVSVSQEKWRYF